MKNNINNNTYCCGCRACEQICNFKAIEIIKDNEGFIKVKVNENCKNCGQCLSVCPIVSGDKVLNNTIDYYAAINKNFDIIMRSSSSGIFTGIARNILSKDGVVYGCIIDINDDYKVKQVRTNSYDELDLLRRSKYVQSDTEATFSQVKEDLNNNLWVLYVGTPCQIAGLKLFLSKINTDKLICIDLICHGTPSSEFFRKNIEYWKNYYKSNIKFYDFRLKRKSFLPIDPTSLNFFFTIIFDNGKKIVKPWFYDIYFTSFLTFQSYNEVCYKCNFSTLKRAGDITLGDYHWAVNFHNNLPEIKKDHSISCVLVNTLKGKKIIEELKNDIDFYPTKLDWIVSRNKNLIRPTPRPADRNLIYKEISEIGFDEYIKKYYSSIKFVKYRFQPIFKFLSKFKSLIKKLLIRTKSKKEKIS